MKKTRIYALLALLLKVEIPTMQTNLKNTLGKKGYLFWQERLGFLAGKVTFLKTTYF